MKPSEILKKTAKLVSKRSTHKSLLALQQVFYENRIDISVNDHNATIEYFDMVMREKLPTNRFWWDLPQIPCDQHIVQILGLLLASDIAESDGH